MKKTELTHSQEERGVFTILHYFLLTAADSLFFPPESNILASLVGGLLKDHQGGLNELDK